MANSEHLAKLKEGVGAWNAWRKAHSRIVPDLHDIDLGGANLSHANLAFVNLVGTFLSGANLRSADLANADLSRSDLTNACLRLVDLTGVNLNYALTEGAEFTYATFAGTVLADVNLSDCIGLETARHAAPSTIGIDTVIKSGGNIPESFLRGAGIPDVFIANMKALVGTMEPIQFYSCFISYSSRDHTFAERLHADLQANGVRCWFAPEDMKIGDKIRPRIDEAIRLHEKLLLVLSGESIQSTWVEKEVETAFEREAREKKAVLFPIRLDDLVMETDQAWAADIRRTRHIGDFSRWKDHDAYGKAFDRLMRDLRTADAPLTANSMLR